MALDRGAVARALSDPRGGFERGGGCGFKLVDVGDVVDEGLRLAATEEADRRRVACRGYRGFGDVRRLGPFLFFRLPSFASLEFGGEENGRVASNTNRAIWSS